MKKTIITVVGKDTVGIIARVCAYLAEKQINILDISQTIVSGYFNMMMVVDRTNSTGISSRPSWTISKSFITARKTAMPGAIAS